MAELLLEISKLTTLDRIHLVQEILRTIELESMADDPDELSSEQVREIEHRSAGVANGTVSTVSWESVQAKIQQRYGLQN